jgi:16S rRNA (guanine527-N7)-methyltransferase
MSLQQKLAAGIASLALDVDSVTQQKLLDYLALIQKWNKVHNLTAVRDPEAMVILHLLDSLSVLPHIKTGRLLDVGSGAGLPGIVLALTRPDLNVTTLDSVGKKASFMRQAKAELGIVNLEVVSSRVEDFKPPHKFDIIISRAFSEIANFLGLTRHLLADNGEWLAMKGVYPDEELAKLKDVTARVVELKVPGLDAQRHLVFLKVA